MLSILLDTPTTDNFFATIGEKLTLIGALGFFLWYFMKELKSERALNESIRKAYEEQVLKLIDKNTDISLKCLDALNKNTESNNSMVEVLADLKETILEKSKH